VSKSFAHWGKTCREIMHIWSNWMLNVWQLQKSWWEAEIPRKPLHVHMFDNSRSNSEFALKVCQIILGETQRASHSIHICLKPLDESQTVLNSWRFS
jgi:hypothetical protein